LLKALQHASRVAGALCDWAKSQKDETISSSVPLVKKTIDELMAKSRAFDKSKGTAWTLGTLTAKDIRRTEKDEEDDDEKNEQDSSTDDDVEMGDGEQEEEEEEEEAAPPRTSVRRAVERGGSKGRNKR
jgi:hypothetical protein